jgi:peroxiredoxin Q/BCP
MAQLRQDYQAFVRRNAEVVFVGPDDERAVGDSWQNEKLPFIGMTEPSHTVAKRYGQEVKLLTLGRMPTMVVIDREGQVRYKHYGRSMQDIAPNRKILAVLDELNQQR